MSVRQRTRAIARTARQQHAGCVAQAAPRPAVHSGYAAHHARAAAAAAAARHRGGGRMDWVDRRSQQRIDQMRRKLRRGGQVLAGQLVGSANHWLGSLRARECRSLQQDARLDMQSARLQRRRKSSSAPNDVRRSSCSAATAARPDTAASLSVRAWLPAGRPSGVIPILQPGAPDSNTCQGHCRSNEN